MADTATHAATLKTKYPTGGIREPMAYVGFSKLKAQIAAKGGASNPGAVAASIGRKKYGNKAMASAAAKGTSLKGHATLKKRTGDTVRPMGKSLAIKEHESITRPDVRYQNGYKREKIDRSKDLTATTRHLTGGVKNGTQGGAAGTDKTVNLQNTGIQKVGVSPTGTASATKSRAPKVEKPGTPASDRTLKARTGDASRVLASMSTSEHRGQSSVVTSAAKAYAKRNKNQNVTH